MAVISEQKKILTLFIETAAKGERGDHHTG